MRHFFNFSQTIINLFWRCFFLLTLYFAVTSPNIILGDNATFGTSTTMLTTGLVIGIVAVLVMNYAYPTIHAWLYRVLVTEQLRTGTILLVIVLVGQIFSSPSFIPTVGLIPVCYCIRQPIQVVCTIQTVRLTLA